MSAQTIGDLRATCSDGGPIPCCDDLCHGNDTTLCGMERGHDFCDHGNVPDYCHWCQAEEDDWYGFGALPEPERGVET